MTCRTTGVPDRTCPPPTPNHNRGEDGGHGEKVTKARQSPVSIRDGNQTRRGRHSSSRLWFPALCRAGTYGSLFKKEERKEIRPQYAASAYNNYPYKWPRRSPQHIISRQPLPSPWNSCHIVQGDGWILSSPGLENILVAGGRRRTLRQRIEVYE